VDKFRYLKPGLSALLIFAGLKILLADIVPIPIPLSLAIIVTILSVAIGASVIAERRDRGGTAGGRSTPLEEAEAEAPPSIP
jgi:tellurite resistance protein TerC